MIQTCNEAYWEYMPTVKARNPEAPCGRTFDDTDHLTVCPHDPLPPKLTTEERDALLTQIQPVDEPVTRVSSFAESQALRNSACEKAPDDGNQHDWQREIRDHPDKPDKQQDAMLCTRCRVLLYPWRTIRRAFVLPTEPQQ